MSQAVSRPSRRKEKFKILTVEPSRRKDGKNVSTEKETTAREPEPEPEQAPLPATEAVPALSPSPTHIPQPEHMDMDVVEALTSPSTTQFTTNDLSQSYISSPEFIVDELNALHNLSNPYQGMTPPLLDSSVFSDLDNPANDVFLPGSAYEALHTALRNRQLWTARPDIPSRTGSPTPGVETAPDRRSESRRPGRFEVSPDRENILWQNYLNEISRHVRQPPPLRLDIPPDGQVGSPSPLLHPRPLSAADGAQAERALAVGESVAVPRSHPLAPPRAGKQVDARHCLVLTKPGNPKEWRRHLDGCAYLIQAAGINGFSGNEEQALFWCFARMGIPPLPVSGLSTYVCGGLISEEETIIPVYHWIPPDMTPTDATALFLASNHDTYANYTVYLCAQTLRVLFRRTAPASSSPSSPSYPGSPSESSDTYITRWTHLFTSVETWYAHRPSQMKSIFNMPTSSSSSAPRSGGGFTERPFPTVLYANGAAISGNQLYHTCALLLLQHKPKTLELALARPRPRSVLWHARQICGISASNAHHGCWTNALQPLWIAGKVMSHYSEHEAILETLERIERETGWATAWRGEDLRGFWGDEGDWDGE
ncbi:uncharacterized protein DSM5745_04812 [Aspergillus mulundensis]|uniref:Transcription factor domain-containing protein n=1 Tax=Aspergillus mulundensis TaxID=1810919 RepID=A0A3D8S4P6_9EURO|nr:Uncharacterized protein DSM5745_04812 [Aspergillus mulundensis]RDW81255.1 Uncharacterized protein DSM5745_04812 [Aspergillus mulundensis]